MRISDWSSDVCSSDLFRGAPRQQLRLGSDAPFPFYRGPVIGLEAREGGIGRTAERPEQRAERAQRRNTDEPALALRQSCPPVSYPFAHGTARTVILAICCPSVRSEEHTSELQSLMRISYAVFCLKK